jgi:peptidoglycan hydrolase CwlO-like protein
VPIFASLMAVFLVAATIFAVLFVTKSGDYNDQKKTAATTKTDLEAKLAKSEADLKKAQEDLANTKRDLGGSQAQADELARQKAVISKCFRLLIEASQAIQAGNQALADQKRAEYTPVCNEADRYID